VVICSGWYRHACQPCQQRQALSDVALTFPALGKCTQYQSRQRRGVFSVLEVQRLLACGVIAVESWCFMLIAHAAKFLMRGGLLTADYCSYGSCMVNGPLAIKHMISPRLAGCLFSNWSLVLHVRRLRVILVHKFLRNVFDGGLESHWISGSLDPVPSAGI
jgi:hypothetical protein